jgi:hypothetical protein
MDASLLVCTRHLGNALFALAALLFSLQSAASELQADIASHLPQQGGGASAIPLLRFWGLVDDTLQTRSSITVPADRLAPGAKGPARLLFLPESLEGNAPLALAVTAVQHRRLHPVTVAARCTHGSQFDTCCTKTPYLGCFTDRVLFEETDEMLQRTFLGATGSDVLAVDLAPYVDDIPVAGPYTQLQAGRMYLALGYTPKSGNSRFMALRLDGKRMEALTHLTVAIARRMNPGNSREPSYACQSGNWRRTDSTGVSPVLIASGSSIDIRRVDDEQSHLLIGSDGSAVVVSLRNGAAAGQATFFAVVSQPPLRDALVSCIGNGSNFAGQIGLFNLLKDPDLSLFLGHALFLSGAWHANGALFDLTEE